jgi:hypothetical protein
MSEPLNRLIHDLSATDLPRSREAAQELAGMAEEGQAASVALVHASSSNDPELQQWAVAALEQVGPPRVEDASSLIALVQGEHALTDYWAVTLLGRLVPELGPAAAKVVAALGKALEDSPFADVRQRAAWSLGQSGAAAAPVREALRQASDSSDARLARLAKEALERTD